MEAVVAGLVPEQYAGTHVLALPRTRGVARTSVETLARAWFPSATWLTPPGGGGAARPMVGARFRGLVPADEVRPGELVLADGIRLVGPFSLTAPQTQALDLPAGTAEAFALRLDDVSPRGAPPGRTDDRDGLARAFRDGLPQGVELHALGWALAAARRGRGAVVTGTGAVLTPEPAAGVDLTLYSAHPLSPEDALRVLGTMVPSSRVQSVEPRDSGPPDAVLAGATAYDGGVQLSIRRVAEVPVALGALDWRDYGPFAYGLTWQPLDPDELDAERPTGLHVIARARVRVLVARLAAMLQGRIAGTLVDDGGFVVHELDLDERLSESASVHTRPPRPPQAVRSR
ncbi:hypothetical protein [Cellulosimicrobium arenosum]|uniref:Uncharacterized protein n=1 Tax=Cellulosimicrobium arenosum TaxID=2708133 RepID=A0A927IZR2_9MICO|nr:hypothetical protein [Cellulosimicrobium arenosum]MBD8078653.1 hypothetical protein [Cellulosimicrobium arenosum]